MAQCFMERVVETTKHFIVIMMAERVGWKISPAALLRLLCSSIVLFLHISHQASSSTISNHVDRGSSGEKMRAGLCGID